MTRRTHLWLPASLVGTVATLVWIVAGGLVSCDSTAKFSLLDRKFNDVQVVSAFPAYVDSATGTIVRVCGAPLDGETLLTPNGLEFTLNFVGSEFKNAACQPEHDLSIKEGDLIELLRVQTSSKSKSNATVGPNNFDATFECIEPYAPATGACTNPSLSGLKVSASVVTYSKVADRCDPEREDTRQNVALLMDASGSVLGFVDATTSLEDQPSKYVPPSNIKDFSSDPSSLRIPAAHNFIDQLNDERDRSIGYSFGDDGQIKIAASDQMQCIAGSKNGAICSTDDDCPNGSCIVMESADNSFDDLGPAEAESKAFGPFPKHRAWLKTYLDVVLKTEGEGRAPLWDGLTASYNWLTAKSGVKENRHIVVLTDGPDTCTYSEDFTFTGSDGQCRTECINAQATWKTLVDKMQQDGWPVIVHFVQFQAKGYLKPDARMQELACRTGGTYQFINARELNLSGTEFGNAMTRALIRVRNALGGTWRVGFPIKQVGQQSDIATGTMYAISGHVKFRNQKFPSLDTVEQLSDSWRFALDGNLDRRMLFRIGCGGHSDCGGQECASDHCTEGGLCRSGSSPNGMLCAGTAGRCCNGGCVTGASAPKCDAECK